MLDFKEQFAKDLKNVFHSTNDFAELMRVIYGDEVYEVPVVIDEDVQHDRDIPSTDHADGIFLCDTVAYINSDDLGVTPRKGTRIVIGADEYAIEKVSKIRSELVLYLQRYDE